MSEHPDVDEQFVRERVLAELAPDLGAPVEECPACGLRGSEQALRTHDCERRGGG